MGLEAILVRALVAVATIRQPTANLSNSNILDVVVVVVLAVVVVVLVLVLVFHTDTVIGAWIEVGHKRQALALEGGSVGEGWMPRSPEEGV